MKVVVGLGNPGREHARNRHNVGFMVIDRLAERWGISVGRRAHHALSGEVDRAGDRVLLVKPQTYMNLSGQAVGNIARFYRLEPAEVLVVYDDLDLELGRIRIRKDGGSGGHGGVASLIEHLGRGFPRVRVGIGRPPEGWDPVDYVLGPFTGGERAVATEAVERAADAAERILTEGLDQAMNHFNSRRGERGARN